MTARHSSSTFTGEGSPLGVSPAPCSGHICPAPQSLLVDAPRDSLGTTSSKCWTFGNSLLPPLQGLPLPAPQGAASICTGSLKKPLGLVPSMQAGPVSSSGLGCGLIWIPRWRVSPGLQTTPGSMEKCRFLNTLQRFGNNCFRVRSSVSWKVGPELLLHADALVQRPL